MTTPEARPAAPVYRLHGDPLPIADTYDDSPCVDGYLAFDGDDWMLADVPGQLWQRLAHLDVELHGEPKPHRWPLPSPTARSSQHAVFIAGQVEARRPAMRAARAELDALNAPLRWTLGPGAASAPPVPMTLRRLEPEPSAMARTGLAVGLAFTSDEVER